MPLGDAELVERVKRLGGTDSAVFDEPELLELVLPALRGDYLALASYEDTAGRLLTCPVVGPTGDRDPEASVEEVEAWGEHTSGAFRTRVFTGGHFFLDDHTEEVAALVRDLLPARAGRVGRARPSTNVPG